MKEHGEVLQIRLPASTMAKVRKLAKKRKVSISEAGRLAVLAYTSPEELSVKDLSEHAANIKHTIQKALPADE
ncbi:MAG: CopG family transcriptional regulator [Anaerolineae bacterium]|jgi:hypothetical protein|nr:CopG family transcriptional regulator [Anaerolineae bacterium]MBT7991420.1 CopG family transcriptional regulator [Anaerolineae bacterium]